MPIRIPQKADTDTQSAFQDVEKALAELSARLDQIAELEQKVKELSIVSDTPRPAFITQGDTIIEGDLRVEGNVAVRGEMDAPHALDGLVVATPEGIGSSAQRVVEVHGSLAVLNALSADTVRSRIVQIPGNAEPFKIVHTSTNLSSSTPNLISGLKGWYKVDSETSLNDNDPVSTFTDRSGNGYNFTGSAGARPLYKTNVVNGYPVIRFDGTDDTMATAVNLSSLIANNAGTIFMVAKPTPNTNVANYYDGDAMLDSGSYMGLYVQTSSERYSAHNFDGAHQDPLKTTSLSGAFHNFTWFHSGGSVYAGVDDTRSASLTGTASGNTSSLAQVVSLGKNYNSTVFTAVDIAELIIFNVALSEADRQSIEVYLALKYGLTLGYATSTRYGDSFRIEDSAGTAIFRVDNSGNVYVGSTQLTVP